ncbi:N-acetylglucosamine-6-phosphate deacetylase [Undibacterium luofuense]|uniref:N-acetylglucosamine-6-phosphate deacetylase n=1 Tax=Undibacterium luofuense TaxID=2828733 RepID=UPI0030EE62A6
MSKMQHLQGSILTPQGWVDGEITFTDRIENVRAGDAATSGKTYILPGFIDLHVHGAGGKDTMEAGDAVSVIARRHALHGTTSMLATTMTAPLGDIEAALNAMADVIHQRPQGAARVLGVHLEGPYINPGKLGAQPDFAGQGDIKQVLALNALAPIRLITIAPEMPGHMELISQLVDAGMRVQIGHTLGTYDEGVQALDRGAKGFTHLFNAMSRFDHRAPGMVGAALAHAEYSEIIPDLLHVHPGAIKAALRSIPHLYCVTDSTSASGMPDGQYMLGRQVVHKCLGGVRLEDGTLAGSTLTMDQALRNLVSIGLSLEEASRRVSTYAADYLGLSERGRLQAEAFADLVVLDEALNLIAVYVEGEKIDLANA